jgi:dihydrolipoamide dehydrogenase
VVLGAGPGGYVAALRAAQLKQSVAIVEIDKPGGVCLNVGCIPSKSLIHQAAIYRQSKDLEYMGITVDRSGFDYAKVFSISRKVADTLSKGVAYLLKKNNVAVIIGKGVIKSPHEVEIAAAQIVTGRTIIIATGSRPRTLPGFTFNEKTILSSTGALMLGQLPKSLLILGAGAIGIEFAHIMNSFGVSVHIVELLERILPLEDHEISETLRKILLKRGIIISTGTKALSANDMGNDVTVVLDNATGSNHTVTVEKILVVTGRMPNTDDIGLHNIGIVPERGCIPVGDYYETSVTGVYAIGDVIASPLLAHVASKEGEIAAEHCAGQTPHLRRIDAATIPGAIYCEPQVASFGLSEQAAIEHGIAVRKELFPYRGIGKSVAIGASEGFIKLLIEPSSERILGAHIIGAQATELIHELLLAKNAGLSISTIAAMIHAHPTLSEGIMEAARMFGGGAIHV